MNDFIFQNTTKIYFGSGNFGKLPDELSQYGKRVLLVYGGGSIKRNGIYDKVVSLLDGFEIYELPGVEPNPRHTTANAGVKICREKKIDVVLAIGGGSAIDCAKAVAVGTPADTDDIWDIWERRVPAKGALPVVTVLTIAATGSEMDALSVMSNADERSKHSFTDKIISPRASFLDPTLTYSVPPYQTACGSFDIMCHIFDRAYFTCQPQLDMMVRIQEQVLSTVVKYAPIAIKEPSNYEARADLMWAATWGLNDFLWCGVSQRAILHAMEHELSAWYDITHGHGLAILTPRWMEHVLNKDTAPVFNRFGVNIMGGRPGLSDMDGAREAIRLVERFCFETLGLKSRLSDLGIDDAHFADMAHSACKGGRVKSMVDLEQSDIEAIYRACL